MTLRGARAGLVGLVLVGCYGMPRIGGSDAGDGGGAGGGVAGTSGSQAAGSDGTAGFGGGNAAGRGGMGGSATGGLGGPSGGGRGGASGGGPGGSSGGGQGGVSSGGQGGLSGSAGSAATGGISGSGGAAGVGGGGGIAGGATGGAGGSGACNPACDATHVCTSGRCLLADAQQCVTASQCASGACNPFYKDVDGDGYGTGQPVGFCTLTAPPIGYAAQNGDCCDDAANIALAKLIHPAADFQSTSAGGICNGITWDYDCSGSIEKANTYCVNCTDAPACESNVGQFADTDCGRNVGYPQCSKASTGGGIICVHAGGNGPLYCR